jgi:hypothetical protein
MDQVAALLSGEQPWSYVAREMALGGHPILVRSGDRVLAHHPGRWDGARWLTLHHWPKLSEPQIGNQFDGFTARDENGFTSKLVWRWVEGYQSVPDDAHGKPGCCIAALPSVCIREASRACKGDAA